MASAIEATIKEWRKKWREPAEKLIAEIASESISEGLKSEKILGGMPPDPPSTRASHTTYNTYTGPAINLAGPLVNCFRCLCLIIVVPATSFF